MPLPDVAAPAVPVLETPRLRMRGYRAADYGPWVAMWQEPAYYRYHHPGPLPAEEVWRTLLRSAGHWVLMGYGFWAVEEKATGRFVGAVGFVDLKRAIEPLGVDTPEMGWVMAVEVHGRGYATEAVAAAQAWGDAHFPHARTVCLVHPENQASLRIAAKFGYREYARTIYKDAPLVLLERFGQEA